MKTLRPDAPIDIMTRDDVRQALALLIAAEISHRDATANVAFQQIRESLDLVEAPVPDQPTPAELRASQADVFRTYARYYLEAVVGAAVHAVAIDALIDAGAVPGAVYDSEQGFVGVPG